MGTVAAGLLQFGALIVILVAVYVPLGDHMARVYTGQRDLGVERILYRLARVDPRRQQSWLGYALAVLGFSAVCFAVLYAVQRLQGILPFSDGKAGVSPATAFNTAISFVTNTNWQSYSPELVMTNLTQMAGLAVQNFVSAAVGMAVAIALVRGIVNRGATGEIGNFWVDLVRGVVRILLPLSIIVATLLLSQGVVQSWHSGFTWTTLDGAEVHSVVGPFASQEAIKELGTNGGGTLSANSAHPFSNPTPFSNLVEIFALLVIPVCLTRTYGTLVRDRRQGLTLLAVMAGIWAIMLTVVWIFESHASGSAARAAGAMMEGKEVRFGIPGSALFAVSTTGTSTGAVNAAHDSFSAAGGGAVLWNMLLGEVAPGGVGSGLYGILMMAVITVFVGGLLVGRSPTFLGKRIGQPEMTMAALYVLVMPALVLAGTAISVILASTTEAQGNGGEPGTPGAIHGFGEVLYAYASAANNNGSAFGGLAVTGDWFQSSLGMAMLLGRFVPIVLVLALAGLLARQRPRGTADEGAAESTGIIGARPTGPVGPGHGRAVLEAASARPVARPEVLSALPTHGLLYGTLLMATIVLVAGLTFFPAMALGPIAEALL
ncbi:MULTISPECIES: potassium-transporting ATPase subunit KdpA [Gordonia]|uniref:Potassium-transporting ATPase potassium-binding subunit n=2 Tax=Gordonia alkanivorans TaxID=84096 RepID=F9VYM3_9ACTN|nr:MULTISPECIES: potassium-transporting ATPase subunit KdpA [Gordonia]ETA07590.1 ATPase [Gordonia alkanivorans CGMCC 6845]MDH3008306.1 potassium-transporting ATPase subunit KdpA [Gordonia alkanivorans]MDH3012353.1 potassium-transporting ATPase subunit KdpA [Gordonia alkanivorans]MDH3017304.1 potassium-transporting ATPase subunit KdpA [Gordonia alkanivorans]MDH3021851.1 potassium-transporting ATPase subunit KdpA [Gordonia alkanivorans]